jgi:hypothetical protein
MIVTCKKIESKSEPSTEQAREKGKRMKLLTFRDEEELGTVRAADAAARERDGRIRAAGGRSDGGATGADVTVPSPPAAAASPLLGFHEGSALGPEGTSGRRRGRARRNGGGW